MLSRGGPALAKTCAGPPPVLACLVPLTLVRTAGLRAACAGGEVAAVKGRVARAGGGLRGNTAAGFVAFAQGARPLSAVLATGAIAMQAPGMQGVDPMNGGDQDKEKLYQLVAELSREETRETALLELSKKRETFPDLAPILWHSFGTTATLLQEIVCIYPLLSPPQLTAHASNRVCNALALLQCVASHQDTRQLFLKAHIPLFLYPFLNTISKTRPFEYLRLTSLGVIGALVKMDDSDVINFLLTTEIIPLCLRIMENGSDLSKTVATFIVQKILLDDTGLNYICATAERFFAVSNVLSNMIQGLTKVGICLFPSCFGVKYVVAGGLEGVARI